MKLLFPLLALGGVGVLVVFAGIVAFMVTAWLGQPIPVLGFEQTFEQPISFPHTVHAGTGQLTDTEGRLRQNQDGAPLMALELDCTFCHRTVTSQASAGVPPIAQCSFCHKAIGSESNESLQQLRAHAGIIGDSPSPVNWLRVHRMPDHVRFVHEPHIRYLTLNPDRIKNNNDPALKTMNSVKPSMTCSTCHGDVASMEQVQQKEPLKMGQCVNCHRDNGAPTDCAACHQ